MFSINFNIILICISISKVNSFPLGNKLKDNGQDKDVLLKETLGYILDHDRMNITKKPFIRSYVIDKMLPNEMHNIKQHLHQKDITAAGPLDIVAESNAPTPTLEMKQKWLVIHSAPNPNETGEHTEENNLNESLLDSINNDKEIKENETMNRIRKPKSCKKSSEDFLPKNSKHCTCMNENSNILCTHQCTGDKSSMCTRCYKASTFPCTRNCDSLQTNELCTETLTSPFTYYYPLYTNFYVPYQPFFIQTPTPFQIDNKNYDYVEYTSKNRVKQPKWKQHTTSQHHMNIYDNFYDDSFKKKSKAPSHKATKEEVNNEHFDVNKLKGSMNFHLNSYYDQAAMNENNSGKKYKFNSSENILFKGEKDKLIANIIDELKSYDSEIVRDCYCSSLSIKHQINIFIPMGIIFLYKII